MMNIVYRDELLVKNSNEYKEEAINGASVNLTIDNSVQLFIENAVKNTQSDSEAEWVIMAVMNAKTGEILGYSSTPSFDPLSNTNILNQLPESLAITLAPIFS